ncbi:MAG: hypothetical protein UDM08_03780 [Eggerthellaceae bacterium]|nr:hypothetical protein [Eggerthellaceae bacterium]
MEEDDELATSYVGVQPYMMCPEMKFHFRVFLFAHFIAAADVGG